MSGLIGHTMYAVLAGKAADEKKLPIAPVIHRHYASYLTGAYLGCDIQTLPESVCVDTGEEVGYGTVPIEKSPLTGGAVKPWSFQFGDAKYTPRDIHTLFYGRAHLAFGWAAADRAHTVPWDHLPDYLAAVVTDAFDWYGPGERKLAYLFGWMAHIVGDSLIKSVQPGVTLNLLDGTYTPANRPIQDLVTYHEIGRKELGLNWEDMLADLPQTPVEPIQLHYMRVTRPRGALAARFPNAWAPQHEELVRKVLAENRRYLKPYTARLLPDYTLTRSGGEWKCRDEMSRIAGGLSYTAMVALADKANFRHALWQIGEAIVTLFEHVIARQPALQKLPTDTGPRWNDITTRWRAK